VLSLGIGANAAIFTLSLWNRRACAYLRCARFALLLFLSAAGGTSIAGPDVSGRRESNGPIVRSPSQQRLLALANGSGSGHSGADPAPRWPICPGVGVLSPTFHSDYPALYIPEPVDVYVSCPLELSAPLQSGGSGTDRVLAGRDRALPVVAAAGRWRRITVDCVREYGAASVGAFAAARSGSCDSRGPGCEPPSPDSSVSSGGLALAACGAALGLVLSGGIARLLVALLPVRSPLLKSAHVDWRAVAFTLSLTVIAALVFAILPAVKGSRWTPSPALTTRAISGEGNRWRNAMIAIEAALPCSCCVEPASWRRICGP